MSALTVWIISAGIALAYTVYLVAFGSMRQNFATALRFGAPVQGFLVTWVLHTLVIAGLWFFVRWVT